MAIDIKNHIIYQFIITLLYVFIWFILQGAIIYLQAIISYLVVLGIMNIVYLNIMLFKQKYRYYLTAIFFSIIFIVYFWGLFIIITPIIIIFDFITLMLRDSYITFGAKRIKDWFVQRQDIELNDYEKDLYNGFVKKYRVIYYVIIILIVFYIFITLTISRLIDNSILCIAISLLVLLVELSIYNIMERIIGTNYVSKYLDNILLDECDSHSYCHILYNLENRYNQFTIAMFYMNGLIYDGQKNQLPYYFDKYDTYKNSTNYKALLFSYIEDNDIRFEDLYSHLRKTYLKKVNNIKFHDEYKGIVQSLEVRKSIKNKQYKDALQILNNIVSKHKISKVNVELQIGICLYEMNCIEESLSKFTWVVDNGNTLGCVCLARHYLLNNLEKDKL